MMVIIVIHETLLSQKMAGHSPLNYSGLQQADQCQLECRLHTKRCSDTEKHLDSKETHQRSNPAGMS